MSNSALTTTDESNDTFEIGGDELLFATSGAEPAEPDQGTGSSHAEALSDIRIRIGTLLKTETVSFLLGAGASLDCGGQLISSVPLAVERGLHQEGITGTTRPQIRRWLKAFYLAVRRASAEGSVPGTRDEILRRRDALSEEAGEPLSVNLEKVLALLYRWRGAFPAGSARLRLDGSPSVDITVGDLEESLNRATRALGRACNLPTTGKVAGLTTFKTLLRKLLTRPLNLKRVNVFTLNYDTLVEQASDAEGVVLLDGFVGIQHRILRPESYEQDFYFPAETTEGRVHRLDRVLHLYKLHGSVTWVASTPTTDNPYGVLSKTFDPTATQPLLIYPTPAKIGETLGVPYSDLFRRFSTALVRPQSVLFVIGYGFGDDHVNAIIRQALAVPSFTLVIVDPSPKSEFVTRLREQKDRRVWIVRGPTIGTLKGFVDEVLPDLRDEEIRRKVLATHRALDPAGIFERETTDEH